MARIRGKPIKMNKGVSRLLVFFIGIPLIRGVFGDEGVIFLMGYLAIFNILVWTYGYYQLSGKINLLKVITNPNIIAVLFGILLFCMPFTLPEVIARPLSMVADTNTAVCMVLVGVLLADFHQVLFEIF